MPAPLLRTDVVAFIAKLRDNPTKAEAIAQAEIDELQARLQPSTLKTYLSWRRTAVLEAFGAKHPAYDMLRLTDEQYRDLNAKYQADVTMRQRHPIRLRHTREMIELGVKLITGRPLGPGADQVDDDAGDDIIDGADDEEAVAAADSAPARPAPALMGNVRNLILGVKLITGRPLGPGADQVDDDAGDDIIDGADDEEAVAAADSAPARPAPALMGNVRNLILGLCLLTGRRPYEIAANPETRFQPIFRLTPKGKVRERFQLEFRGQAKTKGAEASMAHKLNTIPVLADAGLILDAFERLREMIPGTLGMDYETFNRTYAKPLNRRCKQLFGPFWPDGAVVQDERTGTRARGKSKVAATEISVKDLRTVYAEVCSIVFNLTGTVDEMMKPSAYMAKILGHRENDLATAQSYAAIVIEDIVAPGNHPRATGTVNHDHGDDAGGAQRQAEQKAPPAPATASSRKPQTKKGGQEADGLSATKPAVGVKQDSSVVERSPTENPPKAKPQTFRQLLDSINPATLRAEILAQGRTINIADRVKRFRFSNLTLIVKMLGSGNYLTVEFQARPDKPQTIANLQTGRTLTEAEAIDLLTAWAELGRKTLPLKKADAVINAGNTARKAGTHIATADAGAKGAATGVDFDQMVARLDAPAILAMIEAQQGAPESTSRRRRFIEFRAPFEFIIEARPRSAGDQLVIVSNDIPAKKAAIAVFPKGIELSQAHLVDLVDAWVKNGRQTLDQAQAVDTVAATSRRTAPVSAAIAGRAAPNALTVDQMLASLRPEHLGRSARLEQRGNNLVVVFDEKPDQPATIAKVPAGLSLSDTQIGDVFHAWQQGGRKTLTAAATKNALEQG